MTMTTKEADEAKDFLEQHYPLMRGRVLSIHTNKSGSISEAGNKKNQLVLDKLRTAADAIDRDESPFRAVTSVMMLREGWDVRNVTTIVVLRPYSAKAITPVTGVPFNLDHGAKTAQFGKATFEARSKGGNCNFIHTMFC